MGAAAPYERGRADIPLSAKTVTKAVKQGEQASEMVALLRPVDRTRGVDEDLYGQDPSMTARILRVTTWEC